MVRCKLVQGIQLSFTWQTAMALMGWKQELQAATGRLGGTAWEASGMLRLKVSNSCEPNARGVKTCGVAREAAPGHC